MLTKSTYSIDKPKVKARAGIQASSSPLNFWLWEPTTARKLAIFLQMDTDLAHPIRTAQSGTSFT